VEPAPASKQSGDKKEDKQPGECASRETRVTASHINAGKTLLPTHRLVLKSHVGHQPEKNGTEVAELLEELNDLIEHQKHISSKVDDVVSRLQEALKQSTHRSLAKSGKLVRWADSASAYGSNDDTRRPRKRARRSS
jgi:thiamine kinase-like enzyme